LPFLAVNLVSKIKGVIEGEKLVEAGERVLVGVSGGIDSTVLLHLLLEIAPYLSSPYGSAQQSPPEGRGVGERRRVVRARRNDSPCLSTGPG
jgi:NH3-dependent NAD+ synthetase